MLNYDKHKEEIDKIFKDGNSLCEVNQTFIKAHCWGCSSDKEMRTNCKIKTLEWLTSEYKEPILSQEGIEFLKQIIAPFISNKFVSIGINNFTETLRINYEIGWVSYPKKVLGEKWDWFKNLNPEKLYTSEDLGL